MMKYFLDPNSGEVFAYTAADVDAGYVREDLEPMSADQVDQHLNPFFEPGPLDVDLERDRRIDGGVEFLGRLFQSRPTDRENIAGAAQLAFMAVVGGAQLGDLRWSNQEADFAWIAADNSLVPMDAQTVVQFGQAMAARKTQLIFAGRLLKDMPHLPRDFADDRWWP